MYKLFERLLNWTCGLMASAALFAIMWLTLLDVNGRKFLDHSIPGALEITEILMVVVIFGALPLVSWRSEHVVFDTLDGVLPRVVKWLQHRLVHLLCAAMFGFLAKLMVDRGDRFQEYGDITVHLQLPMAPVAYLMACLLVSTALVHLVLVFCPPTPDTHTPGAPT
ncbi:MAG: hypothetical protein RJA09_553 [Pseudomonadota bacterium]|jgi:TRAP-type C4-dicarboxylate transport system permease small subunit